MRGWSILESDLGAGTPAGDMLASGAPPGHRPRRPIAILAVGVALAVGLLGLAAAGHPPTPGIATSSSPEVTILSGVPTQLDPAAQGDLGSAQVSAQLFETLTAFDPDLHVRPALAASWQVLDGGRRVTFQMRDGLAFSDGSPLGATDVVRSWLRILNPAHPSPLASLLTDVVGATDYLHGRSTDPSSVGLRADGATVEVRLNRPAAEFPSVIASPTFAVVPAALDTSSTALSPGPGFVGSGAYVLVAQTGDELTLRANSHYWAGIAAIRTVHLKTSLGGRSPVEAFAAGQLDYTPIGAGDAAWIRFDPTLGPALRAVPSLSVTYYGFDTTHPPFNDVRVRRAFAAAVDWKRIVVLSSDGTDLPATSMVPPGIPGRSGRDLSPAFDPTTARAELAAAGYPGGVGFPEVTMLSTGSGWDDAILTDLRQSLGIRVQVEGMAFDTYFARLASPQPPAFWSLSWVADYPGPNDFLGLLLGSGSSNNYGHWDSPAFDLAISQAGAADNAADPGAIRAAYDQAELLIQRDAPVVPVAYGAGFALARQGLLGASDSGLGIVRLAGLAWASK